MKKILLIGLLLSGCRGKQGPQGTPGLNAPQEVVLSGIITSDVMIIEDPRISIGNKFDGIVIGSSVIHMPYFLISYGTNVYFQVEPSVPRIIIFNAQKAAANSYQINF